MKYVIFNLEEEETVAEFDTYEEAEVFMEVNDLEDEVYEILWKKTK